MSKRKLLGITALTIAIEAATIAFRFGLGLRSTRDTAFMSAVTFGIRIHHGYVGILILALLPLMKLDERLKETVSIIGWSLLLSDLVHHFLVLWPVTGSPEFDILYPGKR